MDYLDRGLLQDSQSYYQGFFGKLDPPNSQGWSMVICPFHKDRNPSLGLNLRRGGYFCFGCGAKGGGIIDFYMQFYDVDFRTAFNQLRME